ncbi:hypothetical protein GCM10027403_07600 [Arthrobacter tecti]
MSETVLPNFDLLVDPRTGILTELETYGNPPEWPHAITMVSGHVANPSVLMEWPADRMSTGTSFTGLHTAMASAVGEAVERYCGNLVPDILTRSSWNELNAARSTALDPQAVLLYSDAQYADPGFPFTPMTRDLNQLWTEGTDIPTGEAILVPGALAWANFFTGPRADDTRTNHLIYAGIAAGSSLRHATLSAMEEVIERDAVEIWWRAGAPATEINVPSSHPLRIALASGLELDGLTSPISYTILGIPNRYGVPVVAVVLRDSELDLVTLGTAARPDVESAILKAAGEALSLRSYAKGLLDPDGGPWRAIELGLVDGSPMKPFRSDRAYARSYRSDYGDIVDLTCQTQFYLDPATRPLTEHLFHASREVELGDVPAVVGDPYTHYSNALKGLGLAPIRVDLTTADIANAGMAVVRVVAPGTYSNAPAACPYLAGERWRTEPVELGFAAEPLTDSTANFAPLPHT